MKYSYDEIAKLPDKLSLEDFRVVCHISKRTARYYLQSGLVICENNGKKTHCYTIRKCDLIAALKEFEEHPCKFYIPKEFYNGGKYHKGKMHILTYLPDDDIQSPVTKDYYEKKTEDLPDLLCSAQVADITGYDQKNNPSLVCRKANQIPIYSPACLDTKGVLYEIPSLGGIQQYPTKVTDTSRRHT